MNVKELAEFCRVSLCAQDPGEDRPGRVDNRNRGVCSELIWTGGSGVLGRARQDQGGSHIPGGLVCSQVYVSVKGSTGCNPPRKPRLGNPRH